MFCGWAEAALGKARCVATVAAGRCLVESLVVGGGSQLPCDGPRPPWWAGGQLGPELGMWKSTGRRVCYKDRRLWLQSIQHGSEVECTASQLLV